MPFNRSNSPYRYPPDCPGRNPECHTSKSDCRIYAAASAKAAEEKAEARRRQKTESTAKAVLIESRQRQKRRLKTTK